MHVLLITSEELHEKNIYSSSFELAQAKALVKKDIKVSILSIGALTTKSLAKNFFYRLTRKVAPELRVRGISAAESFLSGIVTFFRAVFRVKITRRLSIEGITVYEALISRNSDFYISYKNSRTCISYGLKTAQDYINELGKPDIIHAHSRFLLAGLLAEEIKDRYNIPYLLTEHSSYYIRDLIEERYKPLIVRSIEKAEVFTTVSYKLADWVNNYLGKQYPYCIIPNIIDPIFEEELTSPIKNRSFTFLNVAALNKNKGHANLLNAFSIALKRCADLVLRIAGSGEEMDKLKKLARVLGIQENVFFLGQLTLPEVRKEMLACDCFVLASEFETFGVVIIEAMSCGKPCITTRCGGPEELIHSQNGLLVQIRQPEQLADAMLEIIKRRADYDPENIRLECIRKFGQTAVSDKLLNLYQWIVNEKISKKAI
jgi:glycosyltransferase involved in cell wall biosynthesis